MKNRKIYKVIIIFVVLSVLLSSLCINASAYVYEGKKGEYYVPDQLYKIDAELEDFNFLLDPMAPVKRDHWLTYFTAGTNVSQTFTGDDMLLYNLSNDPHVAVPLSDCWLSYVVGLDFENSPLAINFSVISYVNPNDIPDLRFELIFQDKVDFGTSEYNFDDSVTIFTLPDLHNIGYDFIATDDSSGEDVFVVDVEVLVDPTSEKAFFNLIDQNNKVKTLTESINLDQFLGFKLTACEYINWTRMGFESDSSHLGFYEGFTAYIYSPADNGDISPRTENVIKLDGSNYDGMTPNVTNYSNGFSTDYNGYPVIEGGYYKLTTNSSSSSQAQLWFPSQEYGISEFSSEKHSYGEVSFDISAAVRDYVEFKFVEGIEGERWGPDWCIEESFIKIVPVDISFDTGIAVFDVLGCGGVVLTQHTVDVYNEPYANWFNVEVKITLDPIADVILLDYYIDHEYVASKSTPLTTANNSITSIYCSLRTNIPESGILLDNFEFYYVNDDDYKVAYGEYLNQYLDKISDGESMYFYDDYLHARNDVDALEAENDSLRLNLDYAYTVEEELREEISDKNRLIFDLKNNADVADLFTGISDGLLTFILGIGALGFTTPNGTTITISTVLILAVLGGFLMFILRMIFGGGKS